MNTLIEREMKDSTHYEFINKIKRFLETKKNIDMDEPTSVKKHGDSFEYKWQTTINRGFGWNRTVFHRENNLPAYVYGNPKFYIKQWYVRGKLHRTDGPADITFYDGKPVRERWYRNGKRHNINSPNIDHYNGRIIREWFNNGVPTARRDQPSYICYRPDGSYVKKWYDEKNRLHNLYGPAEISYNSKGIIIRSCYYYEGKKSGWHNRCRCPSSQIPTLTEYYSDGSLKKETYYMEDKIHTEKGGPPSITTYKNGKVTMKEWYKHGIRHGVGMQPAIIIYENDTEECLYYKEGVWYPKDVVHHFQ